LGISFCGRLKIELRVVSGDSVVFNAACDRRFPARFLILFLKKSRLLASADSVSRSGSAVVAVCSAFLKALKLFLILLG